MNWEESWVLEEWAEMYKIDDYVGVDRHSYRKFLLYKEVLFEMVGSCWTGISGKSCDKETNSPKGPW